MTTKNSITVIYIRSNEANDIYKVIGNGFDEYVSEPRGTGTTEEDILNRYIN